MATQVREVPGLAPEDVRRAVDSATDRFCHLLASAPDGSVPVPGLTWSVGELGAHLVSGTQLWRRMLTGEPSPITSLLEGATHTQRMIDELPVRDPARLADLLQEESHRMRQELGTLPAEGVFPWHAGLGLSATEAEAVGLGELLVHGFDLAGALGRRWPIEPHEARLVIRALGAVLPAAVDPVAAEGFDATYELRLRDPLRMGLIFHDGGLRVVPGPQPHADCRISAHPSAFLLVAYGRVAPWRPVVRGRLLAWGRRPWLAARISKLFPGF